MKKILRAYDVEKETTLADGNQSLGLVPLGPKEKSRVVVLSWLLRLLVPSLLFRSASKRALGFAFLRDDWAFALAVLVSATWVGLSIVSWDFLGWVGIGLLSWIFGTSAVLLLVNSLGSGAVFIKPLCSQCEFRDLILTHEMLHLDGVVSEAKVWEILRSHFGTNATVLKPAATICSHCPIPARLSNREV